MAPAEIAAAVRVRLAAELGRDLETIAALAAHVAAFAGPAHDARDEPMRASALAFEIERFYTAVESMLERVLRTMDGDVPSGPSSHAELLRAAEVPVASVRPAVVDATTASELRELLRLRHLARHGYADQPETGKLADLATRVARVEATLTVDVARLRAALVA